MRNYDIIHLTSTHPVFLSSPEKKSLSAYLLSGGFLLYDTAGGIDAEAELSVEQVLTESVPDLKVRDLPADHPIYAGVLNQSGLLMYRPASIGRTGTRQAGPRLRGAYVGGRLVAVLSAEDLTAGLLNLPHDEIIGPNPEAARGMVTNLFRWVYAERAVKD